MESEYGELQSELHNVKSKLHAQYVANAQYKRELVAAAKRPQDRFGTRGVSATDPHAELDQRYWLEVAKVEELNGLVKDLTHQRTRSIKVFAGQKAAQLRTREVNAALQTAQFNLKVVNAEVSSLRHAHEQLQHRNESQQQVSHQLALEASADKAVSAAMGRSARAVEVQCAAAVKAIESAAEKVDSLQDAFR